MALALAVRRLGQQRSLPPDLLCFPVAAVSVGVVRDQVRLDLCYSEDVEAEVRLRIQTVGKGGGLYLSPTHVIAPEVPYENLFALVAAAKKYGRYD